MANLSMRYETILILHPSLGEDAVKALIEKFTTLIAEHGTLEKVEEWGKRRLAYPIEDEVDGYYVLMHFESTPDFPTELNRVYKITSGVLRTLVVRNENEIQKPAEESDAPAQDSAPAPAPAEEAPAQAAPEQE